MTAVPEVAWATSIDGGVVTAAVVLVRVGCTKRANIVELIAATAEMGRTVVVVVVPAVVVVDEVDVGVSDAFNTAPLTRKYWPPGPALIGP